MSSRNQVLLSLAIALAVSCLMIYSFSFSGSRSHSKSKLSNGPGVSKPQTREIPKLKADQDVATQIPWIQEEREERTEPATSAGLQPQPVERLTEDWVLGEEPGAVYYLSRIREAKQEGNPPFARELLRQMKENHPESGLIEEAEILLEKGGKIR